MKRGLPTLNTEGLESFIPVAKIETALHHARRPDPQQVRDVIAKALDKQRLEPDELAVLIYANTPEQVAEIQEGARELKRRVYGNRIVLFAPLYIGNECVNDCAYCGFRCSNTEVERVTLSMDGLKAETRALTARGHKRLILVFGEHPQYDAQAIHDSVACVYAQRNGHDEIRRVNINAAPLDIEGYRLVKEAGIGTYQIFQETYHPETYARVHPSGPKRNYLWRLFGLDRAMEAGCDDVGIGALLGLHDWRFEVMALLYHTIHLEQRFGVGPHTISFPRIEPASGSDLAEQPPREVSDPDFMRLVAILRLAVPYTGLILTCREPVALRNDMLALGVSQIDAGSNIGVGAYADNESDVFHKSQFQLADDRPLDAVIRELCEAHFIPSFCTGCYRKGRTGEHFMEFAVPGFVKRFCTPNAVLTLLEYLEDYASPETRVAGLAQLERELTDMSEGSAAEVRERMQRIHAGERDLYF